MLIDTDILICCFRGVAKAEQAIDADPDPAVSVVTWMELVQGCRDKAELRKMKSFLADVGMRSIPLSENIGHRAAIYLEEHALKDGMTMGDD